jgi:Kef-type K+ transport system membrane component KefB
MMVSTALAVGVAKKLEIGSIVALLVVGMTLGPRSPMPLLTGHIGEMQAIGEIGVMLLLFAVGLDLQPTRLWSMQYLAQREELQQMGASHVVALAPEGTLSFGHSVLDRLRIPVNQTEAIIGSLKSKDYAALRGIADTEPETTTEPAL